MRYSPQKNFGKTLDLSGPPRNILADPDQKPTIEISKVTHIWVIQAKFGDFFFSKFNFGPKMRAEMTKNDFFGASLAPKSYFYLFLNKI